MPKPSLRPWAKRLLLVALVITTGIPTVWFVREIYSAFVPSSDFYRSELERLVGLRLPEDAQFLQKTASFPDHFGDYHACFVARVSPGQLQEIQAWLGDAVARIEGIEGCRNDRSWSGDSLEYDISWKARRGDASVRAYVLPEEGIAKITWSLW